ncbi:hypothetical protein AAFC00_005129 [Neodothiora populina]|uniref:Xylanolytic transcriptional activator regulatory domain-containing protein n=1 Tax=Neodothiora populina TaxID=2781224 RepID=A0ABR3PJW6_9PEZI
MGMLSISMQFSPNEDSRVSTYAFHRGRHILSDMETSEEPFSALNLHIVQAHLLLELHALLCSGGWNSAYGLRMHNKSVELARRGGLMEPYPTQPGATGDLDDLWRQFIGAESHKRTLYAVHQLDVYWYHVLSLPRILSHLEIKHDLPCAEEMWLCRTSTEWAHRALVNNTNKSPRQYLATVRECLAGTSTFDASTLDSYGALAVILFLSSSVREASGWSTMTGRPCFERFEALRASLTMFEPLMESDHNGEPMSLLMQATWHMSMIELHFWSASHINGVVEGSLDAALAAATHLSISDAICSSPDVVTSLEPHINFYLQHLDRRAILYDEAPWVTIFAFKVALIAWQLVRAGFQETMAIPWISDEKGMYDWIKTVFTRRSHWCIGQLAVKSLGELLVRL